MSTLQPFWLALAVPIVVGLTWRARIHVLLLVDIATVAIPGAWHIGGVRFDPSDLLLVALLGRLAVTGSLRGVWQRLPYRYLWLTLVVFASMSYLAAPLNQQYLTDPFRAGYQLYRYAWKVLLYYPLAVTLLRDRERVLALRVALVVTGSILSVQAVFEGYAGYRAAGPFLGANTLAGALMIPLLVCWAGFLEGRSFRWSAFHLAAFLLAVRGLLFTGSRGGFLATLAAISCLTWLMRSQPWARSRIQRLIVAAPFIVLLLFAIKPDLLQRPNVRRMLSATEGIRADNFQWRLTERWPHFWQRALEHPILGYGTYVDKSLGDSANTPHNGYLATAVHHGFPVLFLLLVFVWTGLRAGLRLERRGPPGYRTFGALCSASMVALLAHNVVDSTFEVPFNAKLVWIFVGVAVAAVAGSDRRPGPRDRRRRGGRGAVPHGRRATHTAPRAATERTGRGFRAAGSPAVAATPPGRCPAR